MDRLSRLAVITIGIAWQAASACQAADEVSKLLRAAHDANAERRFREAEVLIRSALPVAEKEGGDRLASCLGTLADSYLGQGKTDEAERLVKRALEVRGPVPKPSSGLATDLLVLSDIVTSRGQVDDAQVLCDEAFAILEMTSEPDGINTSIGWYMLGRNAARRKDWGRAEQCGKRALAIAEKAKNARARHTANVLSLLAETALGRRQPHDAERYAKRAIAMCERAYSLNHPLLLHPFSLLVKAGAMRHGDAEVEPIARRSLAIAEQAYGPVHLETERSLDNLIANLMDQGHYAEAEALLARAVGLAEKLHGATDEYVIDLLQSHAETLEFLEQTAKAADIRAKISAIRVKRGGSASSPREE